jgi:hypothetical protein
MLVLVYIPLNYIWLLLNIWKYSLIFDSFCSCEVDSAFLAYIEITALTLMSAVLMLCLQMFLKKSILNFFATYNNYQNIIYSNNI